VYPASWIEEGWSHTGNPDAEGVTSGTDDAGFTDSSCSSATGLIFSSAEGASPFFVNLIPSAVRNATAVGIAASHPSGIGRFRVATNDRIAATAPTPATTVLAYRFHHG